MPFPAPTPVPLRRMRPTLASTAACLSIVLAATTASATEGYLQDGIGARQKALAGAGVADSADATAASLNPAGLVNVQNQINLSASLLTLDGGYSANGTGPFTADGTYKSGNSLLLIPNFAASWRVNWGLVDVVALTVYANGGVSTLYSDVANPNCPLGLSGVFCGGRLGVDMKQTFFSVALAKQVAPGLSVGLAPIVARQSLSVDGVGLFAGLSVDPSHFSNMGYADTWGGGMRGGIEWKAAPGLRFGIAGNTPIWMESIDKYRGLFAEQGRMDGPATVQAGVAVDARRDLTVMLDYKHIWYGSIASVANPTTNPLPFGGDIGPGFGLKDLDVYKLGIEWRATPKLTWRAGYSYNSAPLESRDADLNIMTLGVVQHHITGGFKLAVLDGMDVEFAAMYAPRASLSGPELFNPGRTVDITMSQLEFTVGAVWRFGGERPLEPLK